MLLNDPDLWVKFFHGLAMFYGYLIVFALIAVPAYRLAGMAGPLDIFERGSPMDQAVQRHYGKA